MTLPLPPDQTPRAWQDRCLGALRQGREHYRSMLVSAATGTGKGSLIAGVAELCARGGYRVLVLAHREELVTEIPDRIRRIENHHAVGIVQASRDEWHAPIVCASVQSCTPKRRARMGAFDLVLTDEAHHATAPSYGAIYKDVAAACPEWEHIGFTATPFRSAEDGSTRGLGAVFEALVFEHGIVDAIEAGDLVPLRAWQVSTDVDLSGVAISHGDFDSDELGKAVDTPSRNRVAVEQYLERGRGRPALVFAATVEHAQHLAEAFAHAGVPAAAAWGEMPKDQRRQLVARFRAADGSLPVLVSRDLLFEGFDAPATELIIKARPTKSRVVFQQLVGRGLRLHPGKVECVFVDLVDNGCELDLATAADLTDEGPPENRALRTLQEGDLVRRLHHDDWGLGAVLEVLASGMPRAVVSWPVSRAHRQGAELTHPFAELRRVPPEKAQEPVQLSIAPRGLAVKAYEVFLLPQHRERRVGWYEYQGSHSAGGTDGYGDRVTMLAMGGGKGKPWVVYECRRPPEGKHDATEVAERHRADELALALAWAQSHLDALGVVVAPFDADWRRDPITPAQRSMLGFFGIRRDTTQMSRGEASALIDAAAARKAVIDHGRTPRERSRAAWARDFFRGRKWKQRRAG